MDPSLPAYLNNESFDHIQARLVMYRQTHHARFLEYFSDGTHVELRNNDYRRLDLLSTGLSPTAVSKGRLRGLLTALRYFLFDLQNDPDMALVPHGGPPLTLSNMIFFRRHSDGRYGLVFPVYTTYGAVPYTGVSLALPPRERRRLADTASTDENRLLAAFLMPAGKAYHLDEAVIWAIDSFVRTVRDMWLQIQLSRPVPVQPQRQVFRTLAVHNGTPSRPPSRFQSRY